VPLRCESLEAPMPQMVMNGLARYHAGTAARPPTAEHKFTMCSPWRLSDHQWPRSLCWTSYALARNRETVAIDALGEADISILGGLRHRCRPFSDFTSHRFVIHQKVPLFGHFRERITYPEFCDGATASLTTVRLPAPKSLVRF